MSRLRTIGLLLTATLGWPGPGAMAESAEVLSRTQVAQSEVIAEPLGDIERDVQASDLPPVSEGTSVVDETADRPIGVAGVQLSTLLPELSLPPRSPALAKPLRQVLVGNDRADLAATYDAVFRSGALSHLLKIDDSLDQKSRSPALGLLAAEAGLALGRDDAACSTVKKLVSAKTKFEGPTAGKALLMTALCASLDGAPETAALAAAMLRNGGISAPFALAALDEIAGKSGPVAGKLGELSVTDVRFAALAGRPIDPSLIAKAAPAALVAAIERKELPSDSRLAAAEAAAALSIIEPSALAKLYARAELDPSLLADPLNSGLEGAELRALLYRVLVAAHGGERCAELCRPMFASAGKTLALPIAALLAPLVDQLDPSPRLAEFAEFAVEIQLLTGNYAAANRWAVAGTSGGNDSAGGGLIHWMMLINIADPEAVSGREAALRLTEDLALAGRLDAELLHRLISVLDALEYDIPVPLWEAASRTPQPASGYLPATGRLAQLTAAGKSGDHAETLLLAAVALGPGGAADANLLALGDTIRALSAAGLETEARRIGLEALYPYWPRGSGS